MTSHDHEPGTRVCPECGHRVRVEFGRYGFHRPDGSGGLPLCWGAGVPVGYQLPRGTM